jgi:hypothetical protein
MPIRTTALFLALAAFVLAGPIRAQQEASLGVAPASDVPLDTLYAHSQGHLEDREAGEVFSPPDPVVVASDSSVVSLGRLMADAPLRHEGVLEASDDTLSSGKYRDRFDVEVRAGQTVRVDLASADFDTYLMVFPPGSDRMDNDQFGRT